MKAMQPIIDQSILRISGFDKANETIAAFEQARPAFLKAQLAAAADQNKMIDYIRGVHTLADSCLANLRAVRSITDEERILKVGRSFSGLIRRYDDLYSISEPDVKLPLLPASVLESPPIELFYSSRLLHNLNRQRGQEEREEEHQDVPPLQPTDDSFSGKLSNLDPELVALWEGAAQSMLSSNPDRARHTVTSLRELFTHVLHRLAPDPLVREWTQEERYYYQGRPTRRARLDYICRGIQTPTFAPFLEKDIKVLLDFVELYQKGTHELIMSLTSADLNVFRIRTESAIRFMIDVARIGGKN
jgi:hypothetical protein